MSLYCSQAQHSFTAVLKCLSTEPRAVVDITNPGKLPSLGTAKESRPSAPRALAVGEIDGYQISK